MNDMVKTDPRLISFQTLRRAVGWLGISLPFAVIIGNLLFGHCNHVQDSISHYYYTVTGSLFVGILCSDAMFLIAYRGYPDDKRDNRWTNLAGICALGIAFFPTNDTSADSCAIFHFAESKLRSTIHYGSAALFFTLLACTSLFLFTKSKGEKTKEKIVRNKIYRICGIVMLISISLIALYGSLVQDGSRLTKLKPVFWLETTALLAFGTSWLVKGELILQDKK